MSEVHCTLKVFLKLHLLENQLSLALNLTNDIVCTENKYTYKKIVNHVRKPTVFYLKSLPLTDSGLNRK